MAEIKKVFESAIDAAVKECSSKFPGNTAASYIAKRFRDFSDVVLKRELEPQKPLRYELLKGHPMAEREVYNVEAWYLITYEAQKESCEGPVENQF